MIIIFVSIHLAVLRWAHRSTHRFRLPSNICLFSQDFIKCSGFFSIEISLCERNSPILAVINLPALKAPKLYYAVKNLGSYVINTNNISAEQTASRIYAHTFSEDQEKITVVSSSTSIYQYNKTERFIRNRYKSPVFIHAPLCLRILLLCEGLADVYMEVCATSEWQTCAGHMILTEAGGDVYQLIEEDTATPTSSFPESSIFFSALISSSSSLSSSSGANTLHNAVATLQSATTTKPQGNCSHDKVSPTSIMPVSSTVCYRLMNPPQPLVYNKPTPLNPPFIAYGNRRTNKVQESNVSGPDLSRSLTGGGDVPSETTSAPAASSPLPTRITNTMTMAVV